MALYDPDEIFKVKFMPISATEMKCSVGIDDILEQVREGKTLFFFMGGNGFEFYSNNYSVFNNKLNVTFTTDIGTGLEIDTILCDNSGFTHSLKIIEYT